MSISKSFNKKTGVTYVYEVYANYWDKEAKKQVTKRRCIGKIDPTTGEIIPNRPKKSAHASDTPVAPAVSDSSPAASVPVHSAELSTAVNQELDFLNAMVRSLQDQIDSLTALKKQTQSRIDTLSALHS